MVTGWSESRYMRMTGLYGEFNLERAILLYCKYQLNYSGTQPEEKSMKPSHELCPGMAQMAQRDIQYEHYD